MRARPLVLVCAAGLGMLGGCHTPSPAPAPATEPSASAATAAPASASVTASASASAAPGPTARAADGCWGPELPDSSEARLATLGKRCVRGMTAQAAQRVALRDGAARVDLPAAAAGGGCVRAIVVGEGVVRGELVDALGGVLASDRGPGFALVDTQGPVCARAGQALTLRVSGQGEAVQAQVWTTP